MKHNPGETYMDAIANRLTSIHFARANPQEISNTIWGFATLGHLNHDFMRAASAATIRFVGEFEPQHLVGTLSPELHHHSSHCSGIQLTAQSSVYDAACTQSDEDHKSAVQWHVDLCLAPDIEASPWLTPISITCSQILLCILFVGATASIPDQQSHCMPWDAS